MPSSKVKRRVFMILLAISLGVMAGKIDPTIVEEAIKSIMIP